MSKKCKWLHEKLELLPSIKYPFKLEILPQSGVYFFYEKGETWGHGDNRPRVVRIGTHKGRNFRSRVAEHFLLNESKMNFNINNPKPSDRSIFRKNIGRALLNRNKDPYLKIWEKDFITKENRKYFGHLRNLEKEKTIERKITNFLREYFFFRFIIIQNESRRIGTNGLESRLIGTVSKCNLCKPSPNWLGIYSSKEKIKTSGLWLTQHLSAEEINKNGMKDIEIAINTSLTLT